ncbi:hypothetical protein [Burkholderia plantarii]|uniref:hypothetical protein n=1 Tax=Burkholderia plantarii TaxID=41899 RepID=UPI0006D8C416|nr:hypothetical protein [Burkholderia plantarii]GLZ18789.1 hypothetical protein Bpla01_23190 [Burkholderia plantarii]
MPYAKLAACRRTPTGDAFEIAIDRGRVAGGAHAHLVAFGRAIRDFAPTMRGLVFALRHRRGIDEVRGQGKRTDDLMQASRLVDDARQYATIAVNRLFETVSDSDVPGRRLGGGDRAQLARITAARGTLRRARGEIVATIARMSRGA